MGARREARIAALMALYAREISGIRDIDILLERIEGFHKVPKGARMFFRALVEETVEHLDEIDEKIVNRAQNWAIDRMATVDRNILRMGIAELLYFPDVPPKTTINECIELAKLFGSSESARFVNGLIDGILKHSDMEKARQLTDIEPVGGNEPITQNENSTDK